MLRWKATGPSFHPEGLTREGPSGFPFQSKRGPRYAYGCIASNAHRDPGIRLPLPDYLPVDTVAALCDLLRDLADAVETRYAATPTG